MTPNRTERIPPKIIFVFPLVSLGILNPVINPPIPYTRAARPKNHMINEVVMMDVKVGWNNATNPATIPMIPVNKPHFQCK